MPTSPPPWRPARPEPRTPPAVAPAPCGSPASFHNAMPPLRRRLPSRFRAAVELWDGLECRLDVILQGGGPALAHRRAQPCIHDPAAARRLQQSVFICWGHKGSHTQCLQATRRRRTHAATSEAAVVRPPRQSTLAPWAERAAAAACGEEQGTAATWENLLATMAMPCIARVKICGGYQDGVIGVQEAVESAQPASLAPREALRGAPRHRRSSAPRARPPQALPQPLPPPPRPPRSARLQSIGRRCLGRPRRASGRRRPAPPHPCEPGAPPPPSAASRPAGRQRR